MRRKAIAFLFACCAAAFAAGAGSSLARAQTDIPSPAPSQPPLPSPQPATEDPKIHKLAMQQFLAWQQGQVDRTLYSDQFNTQLTDDTLVSATNMLASLGGLQQAEFRGISHAKQGDVYVYRMTCEHGSIDMDFGLAPDGKIAAVFFT